MAQTRDFVLGLFVGAAVGAAVAILYAPQSGPETRDFLKQRAGDLKDKSTAALDTAKEKVKDVAGNVATSAQQLVDTSKQQLQTKVSAVQAAVDAGKQAFQEKSTQLTEEVQQDVSPATSGAAGSNASA